MAYSIKSQVTQPSGASEAHFSKRFEERSDRLRIIGAIGKGRCEASGSNSASEYGSAERSRRTQGTRRFGGVQDETHQHLSRIGEELWATTSEVQRPDLPGQGEGAHPSVLKPALEPIFQALEGIHEAIRKEDQLI